MPTHILAGLGNPGRQYDDARHNVGFRVIDVLAHKFGALRYRAKFQSAYVQVVIGKEDVVLLKPMTYMNRSGQAIQAAMRFFKVPVAGLLCVHDELDLQFGVVRMKFGGGVAGHNGLRSVVAHIGGPAFARCRVGIGRPSGGAVEEHVLSNFSSLERENLHDIIELATDMIETAVCEGIHHAMNRHHHRS